MTRPITKKVTCPNCRTEGDFIVYTSINATYHPKLLKKMENGELSIWKCPKCKKKYYIPYDYFYHDMKVGIFEVRSSPNQAKTHWKWQHILAIIILLIICFICILAFS